MNRESNGVADELSIGMLTHLVGDLRIAIAPTHHPHAQVRRLGAGACAGVTVVCIADLPPSADCNWLPASAPT